MNGWLMLSPRKTMTGKLKVSQTYMKRKSIEADINIIQRDTYKILCFPSPVAVKMSP